MLMGLVSGLFLADHSDSGSFLGVGITRPRGTPARRILGGGRMYGLVTFSKFFWLVRACWFQVPSQAVLLSDHSCRRLPWYLVRVVVLDSGSPNTDPGPAHSAFPTALRQSSVKQGLCKGLGNCLETPDRSVFSDTKYQLLPFLTVVLASKN